MNFFCIIFLKLNIFKKFFILFIYLFWNKNLKNVTKQNKVNINLKFIYNFRLLFKSIIYQILNFLKNSKITIFMFYSCFTPVICNKTLSCKKFFFIY